MLKIFRAGLASSDGGGLPSTRLHVVNETTTDNVAPKVVLTTTVPAGKTLSLNKVAVTTGVRGQYIVRTTAPNTTIGSGRTHSANLNPSFTWDPDITINAGKTVEVLFTQLSGPAADIETYLMGTLT